jgi:hypothetical protein
VEREPQPAAIDEGPPQPAGPGRAGVEPRADDTAARTAGLGRRLDRHDRIDPFLRHAQDSIALEPEQASDIVFHGRWSSQLLVRTGAILPAYFMPPAALHTTLCVREPHDN